jgi:hypothetical protein
MHAQYTVTQFTCDDMHGEKKVTLSNQPCFNKRGEIINANREREKKLDGFEKKIYTCTLM